MYRLTFDDWPLYDPRGANKIDRLIVREPDVQIGVNKAGSISFVLDPGHPHADKITKLHGTLELTDDAGVLFRGRVLDDRQNFDKSMRYTAEGALAWLNDGIVEPYDFPADFQGDPAYQAAAASGNVVSFYLGWLLDGYNAHAAPERQIKLGNVTVTDPNNYITRADSSYPSTFEVISKKLAGSSLGGYMVMRYEADGNYLDYLSGFVGNNVQEITFGENLLDLVRESTAADLYTAVLPIGSDGLTLSGLPDGPQENGLVKAGKILYDPEAEATYGRIVRKAEYTDITQAENLLRTAIKDLAAEIRLPESLQVKACDLHYLDGKTPSFRLGLYTVVVSAPHGIVRKSYPLTELRPNLLDPGSTPITLNGTASQLTARLRQAQQSEQEQREREIQTVVKEASAWIDEIVKNASGLYCTPEVQPDGSTIYYLHDKPTLKESVNVIKLTSDAIGFSTDGGNTYPYGFSVTGEMIANILYANGVNAGWVRTGILQSADGKTFFLDLDKGVLRLEATELTISGKSVNEALADAITGVEQQFYLSDSPTALAGGEWSNTQPEWAQGKYIWSRQYVTYGNGSHAYLPSESGVCVTGNNGKDGTDGKDGDPGVNGTNGVGVESVEAEYCVTKSASSASGGNWSTTMPAVKDGEYIWTRQKVTYSNGDIEYTEAYCMSKTVGDIAQNVVDAQTQEDIFNKLTNNGALEGLFMRDGKLYINASYLVSGILKSLDGTTFFLDLVNGILKMNATELTIAGKSVNEAMSDAITAAVQQFYLSDSPTALAGGEWSNTQPEWTQGKYIWSRQYVTYGDGTSEYTPSADGVCITGNTGAPGADGTDGTDGASSRVVVTTNGGTTEKIEDWSTPGRKIGFNPADSAVMDTLKVGDQALFRLRNNETGVYLYIIGTIYRLDRAGEPSITSDMIWCEAAGKITSGVDGENGTGIESVTAEYIQSPSATSPDEDPMAQWSADIPEVLPGRYIWTRQKIVYSTGAVEYAGLYCMTKTMGDIAQQKLDAQTQVDIFNKLTNNGALQGVFMRDGQLYINTQYLRGDTIDLNLLRLVGTLCGLMQGFGATASGHTTQGIVIYGNGVDASGNANTPYILVSNEGIRLKDTVGTDFNISYGEAEVNGAFRVRAAAGKTGGVNADGVIHSATQLYSDGDAVAVGNMYAADFQRTSDRRMKKDIEPLADIYARALDNMTPVRYRYKTDPETGPYRLGYIAQDVTAALEAAGVPDTGIVREWEDNDGNAHLAMSYDNLIALLHLKINGLEAEIKQLKEGITSGT